MNRVGQVWDFGTDFIAVIVASYEIDHGWLHHMVWLMQGDKPVDTQFYPCMEEAFHGNHKELAHSAHKLVRIA